MSEDEFPSFLEKSPKIREEEEDDSTIESENTTPLEFVIDNQAGQLKIGPHVYELRGQGSFRYASINTNDFMALSPDQLSELMGDEKFIALSPDDRLMELIEAERTIRNRYPGQIFKASSRSLTDSILRQHEEMWLAETLKRNRDEEMLHDWPQNEYSEKYVKVFDKEKMTEAVKPSKPTVLPAIPDPIPFYPFKPNDLLWPCYQSRTVVIDRKHGLEGESEDGRRLGGTDMHTTYTTIGHKIVLKWVKTPEEACAITEATLQDQPVVLAEGSMTPQDQITREQNRQNDLKLQKEQDDQEQGIIRDFTAWSRVGGSPSREGDGWVIASDGSLIEPDKTQRIKSVGGGGSGINKTWSTVPAGALAFIFSGDTRTFEIKHRPKKEITPQQEETMRRLRAENFN